MKYHPLEWIKFSPMAIGEPPVFRIGAEVDEIGDIRLPETDAGVAYVRAFMLGAPIADHVRDSVSKREYRIMGWRSDSCHGGIPVLRRIK